MKKKISYLIITFLFIAQFNYSQILQGGATHIPSSTTEIPVNDWTYIAITKGANNEGKLYKNGALIYTGSWHSLSYVWSRLDLGAVYYTSFSGWFNGQIDELRVSNSVRTQSEISNHFINNVAFSPDSNTLGLWHFDEINPNIISSTVGLNGAGFNTTSAAGKFGNSISYNGINSRVQINQSLPTSNLTLEFWIKPAVSQPSWPVSFYGMNTAGFSTSLNNCIPPPPTGNSFQTLCSGATVANLNATGTAIKWYAASSGGTALASSTVLINGTTYFATQTVNGCESTTRLEVDVNLNNPTVSASSSAICPGQTTTLTALSGASTTSNFLVGSIGPSGGYVFYDQGSVINGWRYLEGMPYDVVNTNNFGLGCYCNTISNTSNSIGSGSTNTIAWATAGCPTIASTFTFSGFSNWFIPSKDELNLLYTNLKINNLGNFQNLQYWSSSPASYGSCGINGGAWVQNFTNGTQNSEYRPGFQGSGNLRLIRQFATGAPFSTYLWSTGATTASINVTPASTTQYWVDVTSNGVTCRKNITITVNPKPVVANQTIVVSSGTALGANFNSSSSVVASSYNVTSLILNGLVVASGGAAVANGLTANALNDDAFINVTCSPINAVYTVVPVSATGCEGNSFVIIVTVYPNTISVSNPSSTPTLCINTSLSPITHTTSNAASMGVPVGLPAGVTATWASNTITVSGTPEIAGTFNYSIPLTGVCGSANATGTITVIPDNTVTPPSATPTLCINSPLTLIIHTTTGATGIGTATALPAGVAASWISNTLTLSGTPTVAGTFNYSIPLTGGCGIVNAMGSITVIPNVPSPTGSTTQTLCSGATVANLNATGTTIKWYAASSGGTVLASTTALVNGTTYYASQTVNGCESMTRFAVTVSLNNPTISASSSTICPGQSTTLTASSGASTTSNFLVGSVGPSGGYVFYDQGSVINGWRYLEAAPIDNGSNSGIGCYCTAIPNTSNAIGSGSSNTVSWINSGCNTPGSWVNTSTTYQSNGNSGWFIPSKDEVNLMYTNLKLNNLGNFQNIQYWSSSPAQYGSCGIDGGAWVQNFQTGNVVSEYRSGFAGAGNLRLVRRFSSDIPFTSYLWSTGATTPSISVNPTQTTQYSVAITTNGVTCTKNITITVGSAIPAPTGASTQIMSQGTTLANLVVSGQNIVWYSSATGGTPLPANTPLVNGVTYYASQSINGCESQSRLQIIVQIILSSNEFDKIKIVYYPNPVNDMLYIKAPIEMTNVKIYNLLGQKMLQQKFNSNEIQINMSNFSSGTYFVTVESDDKSNTIKILKD